MKDIVQKHGGSLAKLLHEAEDENFSDEVLDARDALIEELTGDPYRSRMVALFQGLLDLSDGFKNLKTGPEIEYWEGDPYSMDVSDLPDTTYVRVIRYTEQKVTVKFQKQSIFRRPISAPEHIGGYEVFQKCLWREHSNLRYRAEDVVDCSVREFRDKVTHLKGELPETKEHLIVNTDENEIVRRIRGARKFGGLTAGDIEEDQ